MLDRILIELGGLPQWAAIAVLAFILWKTRTIVDYARTASASLEKLSHEMNSMRAALELAARAEGNLAGRQEARREMTAAGVTAKEIRRSDEIADAETAAKVHAANLEAHAELVPVATVTVAAPKVTDAPGG